MMMLRALWLCSSDLVLQGESGDQYLSATAMVASTRAGSEVRRLSHSKSLGFPRAPLLLIKITDQNSLTKGFLSSGHLSTVTLANAIVQRDGDWPAMSPQTKPVPTLLR